MVFRKLFTFQKSWWQSSKLISKYSVELTTNHVIVNKSTRDSDSAIMSSAVINWNVSQKKEGMEKFVSVCERVPYTWLTKVVRGATKPNSKNENKFWNYPLTYFYVYAARWFHANLFHIYFEIYKLWCSVVDCCWNQPDVYCQTCCEG